MSHPLLRTLISEMVESYLEESYEDDLIESIFDEVSEETWEAIEEAILNELSPKTLGSYVKKASKNSALKSKEAEQHSNKAFDKINQRNPDFDAANRLRQKSQKASQKSDKRLQGISRATDRLTR